MQLWKGFYYKKNGKVWEGVLRQPPAQQLDATLEEARGEWSKYHMQELYHQLEISFWDTIYKVFQTIKKIKPLNFGMISQQLLDPLKKSTSVVNTHNFWNHLKH